MNKEKLMLHTVRVLGLQNLMLETILESQIPKEFKEELRKHIRLIIWHAEQLEKLLEDL